MDIDDIDDTDEIGRVGGWTFDPAREVWWARTAESTWTEVHGALDDPPTWTPARHRYVGPSSASVDEGGATIR